MKRLNYAPHYEVARGASSYGIEHLIGEGMFDRRSGSVPKKFKGRKSAEREARKYIGAWVEAGMRPYNRWEGY